MPVLEAIKAFFKQFSRSYEFISIFREEIYLSSKSTWQVDFRVLNSTAQLKRSRRLLFSLRSTAQ